MQRIKEILDWFSYHNKNLTKEQYYKLDEMKDIIQSKETRGENMNKYDIELLDSDYWDSEKECFVMTYGADSKILTQAAIKDHDGMIWDCYLVGIEYFPETDQYEVYYQGY